MQTDNEVMRLRQQLSPQELAEVDRRVMLNRKSPESIALLAVIGLLGVAGIHRFALGQVGLGILMLFTLGGCYIWTLIDLFRCATLANEYNRNLEIQYIGDALRMRGYGGQATYAAPPYGSS